MSWPSLSKASSGRPGAQEASPEPETSNATILSAGDDRDHECAEPSTADSLCEPRRPSTVILVEPNSRAVSTDASSAGVDASLESTRILRPGANSRVTRATDRPTTVTTTHDSADHPMRARARDTDETAGTTRTGAPYSSSVVAMPDIKGSPDASTTTGSPANCLMRSGSDASSAYGHGMRTCPGTSGTYDRCREPPHSTPASSTSEREDSGKEAHPSAPIPTTTTSLGTPVDDMAADAIVTRTRREVPRSLGRIWEAGENPAQGPLR